MTQNLNFDRHNGQIFELRSLQELEAEYSANDDDEPATSSTPTKPHLNTQWTAVDHFGAQKYNTKKHQSEASRAVYSLWYTEVLSLIAALVALVAIVLTLALRDGRPLPDWPYRISVNALVSLFAVILKGVLMLPVAEAISQLKWIWYRRRRPLVDLTSFDSASRGLTGAFKLLRIQRGSDLASLGAVITILVVLVDPFVQQLIKYHGCSQLGSGLEASIARTNNYTVAGMHIGAGLLSLDRGMRAAAYKGFLIHTLPLLHTINATCGAPASADAGWSPCNYTLPSGANLTVPTDAIATRLLTNYSNADGGEEYITATDILSYTLLSGNGTISTSITDPALFMLAARCELYPCVKTLSAEVFNNNFTERLIDSVAMEVEDIDRNTGYAVVPGYELVPMPCLIDGTYYNASYFAAQPSANKSDWVRINGLLLNNQTAYVPLECLFIFGGGSTMTLSQNLPSLLTGEVFGLSYPAYGESTPDWMGAVLYNDGNVTFDIIANTWSALAESLTVQIRQQGDASNSKAAVGPAFLSDTCISVQWGWITLPAILLVLAFLFLAGTIVQTARHSDGQVWKASPLALLFHGFDRDTWPQAGRLEHTDDMDKVATTMRVQLRNEQGSWKLAPRD